MLVTLSLIRPPLLAAEEAPGSQVVIGELQTAGTADSGQEFVELYNPTDSDVVLDGWKLQYKSAGSVDQPSAWTARAAITGVIKAHGFYLFATAGYLPQSDGVLSAAGLSGAGGHLRLIDDGATVVDLVGWGQAANAAETTPAPAPPAGQSIERLPGRLAEGGGNAIDSDDNAKDFIVRPNPQPQSSASPVEPPAAEFDPADVDPEAEEGKVVDDPAPDPPRYPAVQITELLVDPAPPLTDAEDEFIELHNPNAQAVELAGYVLRSGANFRDHYTIPALTIEAGGYVVLYARETSLSLTNTGGAAQLLDPAGAVVSQTGPYEQAGEGQVWAVFGEGWAWSLQSTPGRANFLVAPLAAPTSKTGADKKAAAAKKKSSKASVAKAKKAPKAKAAKAAKTPKVKSAKAAFEPRVAASNSGTSGWLLIAAIGLTIAYAVYEFRYDLQNYFYRARRYLKARR
ncbi:lamin tail domain-containing protein [Candidatus Parcubacteria bacterium]|nr:lamin tail domain-containing protein [Candidatus Parcubacteria bacterium]